MLVFNARFWPLIYNKLCGSRMYKWYYWIHPTKLFCFIYFSTKFVIILCIRIMAKVIWNWLTKWKDACIFVSWDEGSIINQSVHQNHCTSIWLWRHHYQANSTSHVDHRSWVLEEFIPSYQFISNQVTPKGDVSRHRGYDL